MNIITKRLVRINMTQQQQQLPIIAAATNDNGGIRRILPPNKNIVARSYVSNFKQYNEMYRESCDNPEKFWQNVAKQFYWKRDANLEKFFEYNFDISKGPIFIKWMQGAKTNICYNLIDRHVADGRGNTIAFYW